MVAKLFENLSINYLELLNDEEDFNVIIEVGESSNTKKFQTHSAVLKYRSLYFRNELENTRKNKSNIKTIKLKSISIQQFDIIIKYIYGGVVLLENYDASFIFDLMLVAHKLLLEELIRYFETHLIQANDHWLRLNYARVYQASFQHNNLQNLQKWCNDIATKYPEKIFDSENFNSLQENALVSLIGRDDLRMKEVKIWNYVINWGIAQNSNLPPNLKDWSHENFLTLKNTLQNCLPLIRYFQISGDDIIDHVEPYKQILDKNLWKDIKRRFMSSNREITSTILPPRTIIISTLPPRLKNRFSTVIDDAHAAIIASWIDRKVYSYSVTNNPYVFKLLLRGSKDGFTKNSFWNLCNKKKNIVIVIKVKGNNEIIGGYNPIGWDKPEDGKNFFRICNDCFIFSFSNNTIHNHILSRVKRDYNAICNNSSYGPCFGGRPFINTVQGVDFCMKNEFDQDNQCYCKHYSYEKSIRNSPVNGSDTCYFSVEEYEIFQIHKI